MQGKKDFPFLQLTIAAAACVAVLAPVRIFQYFRLLEPETGFYAKNHVTVYLVYAAMLFSVVFSFLMSWLNRKNLERKPRPIGVWDGAAALLMAFGLVADAAQQLMQFLNIYTAYMPNQSQSLSAYLSQEGGSLVLLQAVCGLLGTAYFAMLGGAAISHRDVGPKLKILALAPTMWAVMRLLTMFKTKISFLNVSDLFLQLFASAFLMLFLFYFAISLSQVDKDASYYKLFAYGWPAAVLLLTCFLPRCLLLIMGKSDLLCTGYGVSFTDGALAAGVVIALVSRAYTSEAERK